MCIRDRFVVALSLILLSLLGTVAHATGLVDDTINAENLYSKYPLSNYQLDFYVDNSWSWLPWNWLDGIGKSVQYGLYCITNFCLLYTSDALPHALIAGGTGGGKTYFLLTLIEALLHTNAVLYILDPKNSDLADLGTVMPNVYHTKEEMIDCVNAFYEGMVQRLSLIHI